MLRVIIIDETVEADGLPRMELVKNVELASDIVSKIVEIIDEEY